MTPEFQLLGAIRCGDVDEANSMLYLCADYRHDGDETLSDSVIEGDVKMMNLVMTCYPDEAMREEAVERVSSDYMQMIDSVRKRHKELIARRVLKELSRLPIEL